MLPYYTAETFSKAVAILADYGYRQCAGDCKNHWVRTDEAQRWHATIVCATHGFRIITYSENL